MGDPVALSLVFGILVGTFTDHATCLDNMSKFVRKTSDSKRSVFMNSRTALSDVFSCARLCNDEANCNSLQFNEDTGLCTIHPVSFERMADYDAKPEEGNVVYYRADANALGSSCTSYADCHVINSTCYQGVCACIFGYSFSQSDNSCLRDCSVYGQNMTMYPELGIYYHHDASLYATLEECSIACVTETSFQCLSFDYSIENGLCYLSASGYLDVSAENRDSGASGWIFASRSCAQDEKCVTDNDCNMVMSVCYQQECVCTPGYSFQPSDITCVRNCSVYGQNMTMYPELGIYYHNDASLYGTLEECSIACVTETSFQCRSFDYSIDNGLCYLSASGYLDVSAENRDSGASGWIFGSRNCD